MVRLKETVHAFKYQKDKTDGRESTADCLYLIKLLLVNR